MWRKWSWHSGQKISRMVMELVSWWSHSDKNLMVCSLIPGIFLQPSSSTTTPSKTNNEYLLKCEPCQTKKSSSEPTIFFSDMLIFRGVIKNCLNFPTHLPPKYWINHWCPCCQQSLPFWLILSCNKKNSLNPWTRLGSLPKGCCWISNQPAMKCCIIHF